MTWPIVNQVPATVLLDSLAWIRRSVLVVGRPGMGKTTIAQAYLRKFGHELRVDGPAIRTAEDVKWLLEWMLERPVLIDEAHRLSIPELLYSTLDNPVKGWPVIALTTTDEGELPAALRSRLTLVALQRYELQHLAQIAQVHTWQMPQAAAGRIAQLARGNPRRAVRLAEVVQLNWARWKGDSAVKVNTILESTGMEGGLDARERDYLRALRNGPLSISTLAATLGTGRNTIREIESYLIAAGLVTITSRGRLLKK